MVVWQAAIIGGLVVLGIESLLLRLAMKGPKPSKRQAICGYVIGAVLGMLLSSMAVVFLSGWLLLGPAEILFVIVIVTVRLLARYLPSPSLALSLALLLLGIPLAAYVPYFVQEQRLRVIGESIPLYPGAELSQLDLYPLTGDEFAYGRLRFRLDSNVKEAEVVNFYQENFTDSELDISSVCVLSSVGGGVGGDEDQPCPEGTIYRSISVYFR